MMKYASYFIELYRKNSSTETMAGNVFGNNKIELAYKEYLTQHTNCNPVFIYFNELWEHFGDKSISLQLTCNRMILTPYRFRQMHLLFRQKLPVQSVVMTDLWLWSLQVERILAVTNVQS